MNKPPVPMSPAQARFISALSEKLGYTRPLDMWREYGFVEQTAFGEKPRAVSKVAASNLINQLKQRAIDREDLM